MRRLLTRALTLGVAAVLVVPVESAQAAVPVAFGPAPYPVREIVPGTEGVIVRASASLNRRMLLLLDDRRHGTELWTTDGTRSGTVLLRDICPGPGGSGGAKLVVAGSRAYFAADDCAHGQELWSTNGTAAGTSLVKDETPGPGSSSPSNLTSSGGRLYYAASTPSEGRELHVTTGTAATTSSVDLEPGPTGSDPGSLAGYKALVGDPDAVVFAATTSATGREPWFSAGSLASTTSRGDLNPGPPSSDPSNFAKVGASVVFSATTNLGTEPWSFSGEETAALVKDINPGPGSSDPREFVADPLSHDVVFAATADGIRDELWGLDRAGSDTDAHLVYAGDPASGLTPGHLVAFSDWGIFFSATSVAHGRELWFTQGNNPSTRLFKDVVPGPGSSSPGVIVPGSSGFAFDSDIGASYLYRYDGKIRPVPGTTVHDHVLGYLGSTIVMMRSRSSDPAAGAELWAYTVPRTAVRAAPRRSYTLRAAKKRRIQVPVSVSSYITDERRAQTGRVVLKSGTTVYGQATLRNGRASIRITKRLRKGTHRFRVSFGGNVDGQAAHSAVVKVKVVRG
ncbi:hypothetical protein EFK50_18955 [Nocardioides marmoriginsengisoli]|uniref:Bacterial Ig-like domain-containing protein n=1 Tax=Nocardioides marmoriginsengisoli TaxID=661483 RepID=A0A3N0CAD3_9ACTN|nr:ELWxxDGT repeat protein [Nocardioides marmoriginsengisoli]RNL60417.1 hypothetical protein EFK50_18955 [Nocardioides marmoriginsengisoli]